jgi:hypothetical protein
MLPYSTPAGFTITAQNFRDLVKSLCCMWGNPLVTT